jgi:hypothetical protein
MGVNLSALSSRPKGLWGASPLYVNPVNVLNILTKVLAEDKGGTVPANLLAAIVRTVASNAGLSIAEGLGKLTLYAIIVFPWL